jgi:hypothetical protein
MSKELYSTCEANGPVWAEKIADRHRPGGDLYVPGNRVRVEHGEVPCFSSALPNSDAYGRTEPGYHIIVENDRR